MWARYRSAAGALAAAALIFVFLPRAAGAQPELPDWARDEERPGPQFELYLSSLFANSATEGSFGLRGAFHLKKRFALEGSLSRIADDNVDLWLVDFSAKYHLRKSGRGGLYLLGGPGAFLSGELDASELMLHLGIGAEVGLSRRLYFRPELRGRWFAENVDAINIVDLAVGFGWRIK